MQVYVMITKNKAYCIGLCKAVVGIRVLERTITILQVRNAAIDVESFQDKIRELENCTAMQGEEFLLRLGFGLQIDRMKPERKDGL